MVFVKTVAKRIPRRGRSDIHAHVLSRVRCPHARYRSLLSRLRSCHARCRRARHRGRLPETVAGALAYFRFFRPSFFYWSNPTVRTVSCAFILFNASVCLVAWWLERAQDCGLRLFFIPGTRPTFLWLLFHGVGLAFFVVWVVLVVKALQGEMFKLPLVGEFAGSSKRDVGVAANPFTP